jgi:hypothetical protein
MPNATHRVPSCGSLDAGTCSHPPAPPARHTRADADSRLARRRAATVPPQRKYLDFRL